MTPVELAYAAGIMDGEGTISIGRGRANGRTFLRPVVNVANTDWRILEWFRERFGGSITTNLTRLVRPEHHKVCGRWNLCGMAVTEEFVRQLLPFLLLKRAQAEVLLAFCATKKPRKGSKKYLDSDTQVRRISLHTEMSALNKRGVA